MENENKPEENSGTGEELRIKSVVAARRARFRSPTMAG